MPRKLEFTVADGILRVTLMGERAPVDSYSTEEALASWAHIAELRERHNVLRVLVDDQLTGEPSAWRAYAVATSVNASNATRDVRSAIVIRDERVRKHVAFATKIANARGRLCEVFDSVEAAEEWLRSESLDSESLGKLRTP